MKIILVASADNFVAILAVFMFKTMEYKLIAINNYNDYGLRDAVILHLESHPNYDKNEPYMVSRSGKSYTLRDIRNNVDGKLDETVRKILLLTLDLLTRGKRVLDM